MKELKTARRLTFSSLVVFGLGLMVLAAPKPAAAAALACSTDYICVSECNDVGPGFCSTCPPGIGLVCEPHLDLCPADNFAAWCDYIT